VRQDEPYFGLGMLVPPMLVVEGHPLIGLDPNSVAGQDGVERTDTSTRRGQLAKSRLNSSPMWTVGMVSGVPCMAGMVNQVRE
jgi:hypothetical protein